MSGGKEEESVQRIYVKCGPSGVSDFRKALADLFALLQQDSPSEESAVAVRSGRPSPKLTKSRVPLTKTLQRMYDVLATGGDIHVDDLLAVTKCAGHVSSVRKKQQTIGPYISKLNRRLRHGSPPQAIQSGALDYYYRLVTLDIEEL